MPSKYLSEFLLSRSQLAL